MARRLLLIFTAFLMLTVGPAVTPAHSAGFQNLVSPNPVDNMPHILDGLLVGSDTDRLGKEYHARIGMFPPAA